MLQHSQLAIIAETSTDASLSSSPNLMIYQFQVSTKEQADVVLVDMRSDQQDQAFVHLHVLKPCASFKMGAGPEKRESS